MENSHCIVPVLPVRAKVPEPAEQTVPPPVTVPATEAGFTTITFAAVVAGKPQELLTTAL